MILGIGNRGTRLTHEKILSEESVQILEARKNEFIKLPAGTHRFPFAFIVPNVSDRTKRTSRQTWRINYLF